MKHCKRNLSTTMMLDLLGQLLSENYCLFSYRFSKVREEVERDEEGSASENSI